MTNNINAFDILVEVVEDQYTAQEVDNKWIKQPLEKLNRLKNDFSGKAGEKWAEAMCKRFNIPHLYDEDMIDDEASYDITIKGNRVEVKTARQGRGLMKADGTRAEGNWQHESLREFGCEKYMFIDTKPDGFYVTIIDGNFDYSKKHPIMGVTPHCRKGTSDVYKFDFSVPAIKRGLKAGVTMEIDSNTPLRDIRNFFQKHL